MSLPCLSKIIPKEGWRIPPSGPLGVPIRPFGVLVGTGVVLGYHLGQRRAKQIGLDPNLCANGMMWTVVVGFIVAHLVSVIFYFPSDLLQDPLILFKVWQNLSSFGGFIGGLGGAFYFFHVKHRTSLLAYSEAILFGLVPGWVLGRMGCTVVHDHPGLVTDFFLGVRCGEGGATVHDLGLYELLFTLGLTAILYSLRRKRLFVGFYQALVLLMYAPVRFMFDFLRTQDVQYFMLTPAQYFAVIMFGVGLLIVKYGLVLKKRGIVHPADLVTASAVATSKMKSKKNSVTRQPRRGR